jgi:two-component system nitrogen regulation response regulator NtrX
VLNVPPLEERREDIDLLANAFLQSVCADMQTQKRFSAEALAALRNGSYPGNIRELKHIVTRAAVFSDSELIGDDAVATAAKRQSPVSLPAKSAYMSLDYRSAREHFEQEYFSSAMAEHAGNVTATAASIGMAQSNLSRKLKDLGLR